MALTDLTRTIPSYKIVKSGWVKFPFNIGNIDMRTAGGLKRLEAAVRSEMTHHGWTVQKNEKEICTTVVKLMHHKEMFGEFEPEMDANIKRQTGFTKTISLILDERTPFNQNTLVELTEAEKGTKAIENKMTSSWIKQRLFPRKLEDYKYLICHEQAPVASYVLHKLGIPNDLCYGVGYITNKSSDNSAALHCFVQCESTNIVDATDKAHPFCRCLNGAKISRGEIAITDNGNKAITVETYGGGRASFGNMVAIVFSGFKSNHLFATRDKMLSGRTGKDYTGIVTPTKYTSQEIHKADTNHDGLLSKVEINALHNLKTQAAISVKAAELPKLAINRLSRRQ